MCPEIRRNLFLPTASFCYLSLYSTMRAYNLRFLCPCCMLGLFFSVTRSTNSLYYRATTPLAFFRSASTGALSCNGFGWKIVGIDLKLETDLKGGFTTGFRWGWGLRMNAKIVLTMA